MKIITSNTSRGAYRAVVKQLKSNMDGKSKNVVIAPDRYTASVERGLISSLKIESTFGIEVMSFTRLASKLIGSDIKKCLTPEGSVMLIGKVIADIREELVYYKKVALTEGFASELYAALTAIRNSGITSSELVKASQNASSSLKAKTKDLALIYDGYLSALEGRHSDSSTRLYALAKYIEDNPQCVAGTNFYCTDIYDFSAPELEIMKGLANNALSLTIGITGGYDNPNKRIYPDGIIKKLVKLCPSRAQIESVTDELAPPMQAISTKLFSYINTTGEEKIESGGKVKLRVAKDRTDEVLALACDVIKHVREDGRYGDIEVFTTDLEAYESEIKSTFERYEIPYYIDKKELLSDQAKAKYVLQALACVRSNFRRRECVDFVKNPLFYSRLEGGIDETFLFENYLLKYNIEFVPSKTESKFTRVEENKYKNSKQQNECFINAKSGAKTVVLNNTAENEIPEKVREALLDALKYLPRGVHAIGVYVNGIREALSSLDKISVSYADELSSLGGYYKKYAEQVDSKIAAVLDEIDDVLNYDTDIEGFESVFKSMLKTLKIALVPAYVDCVFIGDGDSRFSGECDVYVMGANGGKLPQESGGGTIISPKDEEMLGALGIDVCPSERQKVLAGMYAVCDLMKKPCGKLVVSYPESGDGGALRPSTVIFELQNMLCEDGSPLPIERIDFENFDTRDGYDYDKIFAVFSTSKGCKNEVMRFALSGRTNERNGEVFASASEFVDKEEQRRMEKCDEEPVRILSPDGAYFGESTSVSRLETFYGCPYAHYLHYVLSLKRRKDGKFEGTENGTILHYILEQFFKDVRDGNVNDDTDIEKLADTYFYGAIKEYGYEVLLEKADTGRLLLRVKDEGIKLCNDLYEVQKRSHFRPYLLEAKIGKGDIQPMSLDIGDRKVALKGTIDRVDVLSDKFIIIDYKTYKSADLSLKELYTGQKIQLYVYMRAVEKSIDAKPSGVFYFPIFSSFTDEVTSRYKYKGQASNSTETLFEIDERVRENAQDSIVPYKTDKKGELNGDVHLGLHEFDLLGDYAVDIATKGAVEIANGYVKPSPVKEKCKKCDYASICAYKGRHERKLPKVSGISSFEKEDTQNE